MSNIELSPGQTAALKKLMTSRERAMTLVGPAGTGKTTLMQEFIHRQEARGVSCILLAPTAKAAQVLSEKTGRPAFTIHSQLYSKARMENGKLIFGAPKTLGDCDTIVVIDEYSMVGTKLDATILRNLHNEARLLRVGDPAQLQPVDDTACNSLSAPTAALTEIHRQAEGSSIIQIATAIREGRPFMQLFRPPETTCTDQSAAEWYCEQPTNSSRAVITYKHFNRKNIIKAIRRRLEKYKWLEIGEQIVCSKNNPYLGLINGEVLTISSITELPDMECSVGPGGAKSIRGWHLCTAVEYPGMAFIVNSLYPELSLDVDKKDTVISDAIAAAVKSTNTKKFLSSFESNAPMIIPWRFAYCVTIHTAQGSQWDKVYMFTDHREFSGVQTSMRINPINNIAPTKELFYTAVTRAAKEFYMSQIVKPR